MMRRYFFHYTSFCRERQRRRAVPRRLSVGPSPGGFLSGRPPAAFTLVSGAEKWYNLLSISICREEVI